MSLIVGIRAVIIRGVDHMIFISRRAALVFDVILDLIHVHWSFFGGIDRSGVIGESSRGLKICNVWFWFGDVAGLLGAFAWGK